MLALLMHGTWAWCVEFSLVLAMSSRKKRTAFTPTQKQELEAAYKGGLDSVAAENATAIADLARSLDLEVDVVKVLVT